MLSESGASPAPHHGESWLRESRQTSAPFLCGGHGHPEPLQWVGLSRALGSFAGSQGFWPPRVLCVSLEQGGKLSGKLDLKKLLK